VCKIVNNTHSGASSWEKYSAVNLSRLADLGTVEFRHLPGTRDGATIAVWLRILNDLRAFSKSVTEEEFLRLLEFRNAHMMLHRVFSPQIQNIFATKQITALCKQGIDIVFSALMGEKFRVSYLNSMTMESPFNEWVQKGRK
jgi:hypothetical protein